MNITDVCSIFAVPEAFIYFIFAHIHSHLLIDVLAQCVGAEMLDRFLNILQKIVMCRKPVNLHARRIYISHLCRHSNNIKDFMSRMS